MCQRKFPVWPVDKEKRSSFEERVGKKGAVYSLNSVEIGLEYFLAVDILLAPAS